MVRWCHKRRLGLLAVIFLSIYLISANWSDTSLQTWRRTLTLDGLKRFPYGLFAQVKRVRLISPNSNKKFSVTCGDFMCQMEHGSKVTGADLVVFNTKSVENLGNPPKREKGSLWAFRSTEPQWLDIDPRAKWDGHFNYSLTYLRQTLGAKYNFADEIVRKERPKHLNFSAIRTKKKAKALWFVSHCSQPGRNQVRSGRMEYVAELAQHFPVDIFSRSPTCRTELGSMLANEDERDPPQLKQYAFYLAFENSLCKDYISEKLWKVLEKESNTIPIVLGGLSIDEYTQVAPPNSFIHVRNFTSPKALADHLKYVTENDEAFKYYTRWRNKFDLTNSGMFTGQLCYMCELAHLRPASIWKTFSKDYGSHNCLDMQDPSRHCPYYNLTCKQNQLHA